MAKLVTNYLFAVLLVSLGFFGVGAFATAAGPQDPLQSPSFSSQEHPEAGKAANPPPQKSRERSTFDSL